MTGVFFGKTFANKYVPQMAATAITGDFGAAAIGILGPFYGPGNFLIKTGPATAGVKFAGRGIKRCIAAPTMVSTFHKIVGIFPGKRGFGAFAKNDAFFFGGKGI